MEEENSNESQNFPVRLRRDENRAGRVFAAIVLAFVFLAGKAVALNLVKGEEYQKQVMSQMRSGSQIIHFKRGDILDTNDTVLATSERSYNVILDVAGLLETRQSPIRIRRSMPQWKRLLKGRLTLVESRSWGRLLQDESDSRYVIA
ncbi:hypothetical protein [Sellimonas intestinalis]|uniref:hypothetical protein n=1 Tax=Sellimonas intestinalis TaxID=1653434 RepID=UPI00399A56BF